MAAINPYLTFSGTCEEAFNLYKSVFGTEFITINRFKEAPGDQQQPGYGEKIMHVSLPIGEGTILMGSDCPPEYKQLTIGNNFAISVNTHSEEEADKIFNALAEGGNVTMPMEKTFWGAYFGMLTDRMGINWMVNFDFRQN